MKNKRITVTAANINLTTDVIFDVSKTGSETDATKTIVNTFPIFPKQISFVNTSKENVEINTFMSEEEYQDYVSDPTDYDFIYVPQGMAFSSLGFSLQRVYKFVIRGMGTAAKDNIIIDFINYRKG